MSDSTMEFLQKVKELAEVALLSAVAIYTSNNIFGVALHVVVSLIQLIVYTLIGTYVRHRCVEWLKDHDRWRKLRKWRRMRKKISNKS